MSEQDQAARLPAIGEVLRRQRWVIVASVIAGALAGVVFAANVPASYTATAAVLLSPAPGNPLTADAASAGVVQMTVALETEAQMMRTPGVAQLAAEDLGRPTPDTGERLAVSVPSNTQMLEIAFTADSPDRARAAAQAFAESYLAFRAEKAASFQDTRIERLEGQVSETDVSLRQAITSAGASGEAAYQSQQVQLLADRLGQLSSALSTEQAVSTDPGSIVNDALLPEGSNELPGWIYILGAILLGAVGGIGIGYVREWRRDLVSESESIGDGVPVLGSVRVSSSPTLAVGAGPDAQESYRRVRAAVIANAPKPNLLSVASIANTFSAEIATNLAIVLAEARFRVILVCADAGDTTVRDLLRIEESDGLAEIIADGVAVEDALASSSGVTVLTSGRQGASTDGLTATDVFRATIDGLRTQFDYVVLIAGEAGSAHAEATMLAADSAIVVLAPGETTRSALKATWERYESLGVEVLGSVDVVRPAGRDRGRRTRSRGKSESGVRSKVKSDGKGHKDAMPVDLVDRDADELASSTAVVAR